MRIPGRIVLFFLALSAVIGGFSLQSRGDEYQICERELIRISVYEHPDLSGDYRVSGEGTISFPLLGDLEVAGLTEKNLQKKLTELLAKGYLVDPQIIVRVVEYRDYVYVTGEVKKPGAYSYEENMTVIKAVTLAGGLTDMAAAGRIRIKRQPRTNHDTNSDPGKEKKAKEIKVKMDDLVLPNDIIIVPERFF